MKFSDRTSPAVQPLFTRCNKPNIVFVTMCTKYRRPLLARPEIHTLLNEIWSRESNTWLIGRYVILPDHLHFFAAPKSHDAPNVRRWIQWWKADTVRQWPYQQERPIWQKEAWDRQLRTGASYDEKWRYVRNNPVRHQLVTDVEDWPYTGTLHTLAWHG